MAITPEQCQMLTATWIVWAKDYKNDIYQAPPGEHAFQPPWRRVYLRWYEDTNGTKCWGWTDLFEDAALFRTSEDAAAAALVHDGHVWKLPMIDGPAKVVDG